MAKHQYMPIIFMMFGIVLICAVILAIAWYYGTDDWTWIAQQNASFVLILTVLGIALIVLVGWLRGKR